MKSYYGFRVTDDFIYDRNITLFKYYNVGNRNYHNQGDRDNLVNVRDVGKFPWHATSLNKDNGLSVELRPNSESSALRWIMDFTWFHQTFHIKFVMLNFRCSNYAGYQIFIHGSDEHHSYENRYTLRSGEVAELIIKPKMIITDESLRGYSAERWEVAIWYIWYLILILSSNLTSLLATGIGNEWKLKIPNASDFWRILYFN